METIIWVIALVLGIVISFVLGRNLTDQQFRNILVKAAELRLNAELSAHERAVEEDNAANVRFARGAIAGTLNLMHEIGTAYRDADYTRDPPLFSGSPLGANEIHPNLAEQLKAYCDAIVIEASERFTQSRDRTA